MRPIVVALLLLSSLGLTAQEAQIEERLHHLRQLPDAERVKVTGELALEIRRLPAMARKKEALAEELAGLVTEGDPGHETLQEVATTLAEALRERPVAPASMARHRLTSRSPSWCAMSTCGSHSTIRTSLPPRGR